MWRKLSSATFESFRAQHRHALLAFATRQSIAGREALSVLWELSLTYGDRLGMAWLDPEEVPERAAEYFADSFLVVLLRDGETVAELDTPLPREVYARCVEALLAGEAVAVPEEPRLEVAANGEAMSCEYQPVDVNSGVPAQREQAPRASDLGALEGSPLGQQLDATSEPLEVTPLDPVTGLEQAPPSARPRRSDELQLSAFTTLQTAWERATRELEFTPVDPGSGVPVEPNPWVEQLNASDLAKSPAGFTRFARLLYGTLDEEVTPSSTGPATRLIAPFALVQALAAAIVGARGEMRDQIGRTLQMSVLSEMVPYLVATLRRKLSAAIEERGFRGPAWHVATGVWVDEPFPILSEFAGHVGSLLQAKAGQVDFRRRKEPACATIDTWVRERTAGKIPFLLRPEEIGDDTRLMLASAANLAIEFTAPLYARGAPLSVTGGKKVDALVGVQPEARLANEEGEGWRGVELALRECAWRLRFIVPTKPAVFATVERAWVQGTLDSAWHHLTPQPVELQLPRLRLAQRSSLETSLSHVGMPAAFDAELANFYGISGTNDLYLHRVLHHASLTLSSSHPRLPAPPESAGPSHSFVLDRPFLFEVRDEVTDTLLLMGRAGGEFC